MRARLEKIQAEQVNRSFICYEVKLPHFEFFWHFHPEYELTYIVKGRGKRLVGDSIESFSKGDFVLLGPGLPHVWVSDKPDGQPVSAIVVQFSAAFISSVLSFSEMGGLSHLLKKAHSGICFKTSPGWKPEASLQAMLSDNETGSLLRFLDLLSRLSTSKYRLLASGHYKAVKPGNDEIRINKVLRYIQQHFREAVSVQKAAALLHLSESAFCKYFKRTMGKTFSDYVNDIRVAHAASLLIETDQPVAMIATGSGFSNVSYFNRVFLRRKKIQPFKYRAMRKDN